MPSFIGEILEQGMSDKDRDSLKYAAATMYAAGADTVCEKRIFVVGFCLNAMAALSDSRCLGNFPLDDDTSSGCVQTCSRGGGSYHWRQLPPELFRP